MNKEIRNKLHSQYIQGQKRKLESDPYYISLRDKLVTILTYTVPVVTITNGFVSQEMPENYDWVKREMDEYVKYMYPNLMMNEEKEWHPNQEYLYPKERFMKPWDIAYIGEPRQLNLNQIDGRLSLFSEYLEYRLNNYILMPFMQMQNFKLHGFMYVSEDGLLTFDEWLYLENYDQLVNIVWNQY